MQTTPASDFSVDSLTDRLAGWVLDTPGRAIRLGRLESRWYADRLREIRIERPVFIAGLARAGSTILLEFAAGRREVATHRYRDYPFVHAPLWWNRYLDLAPRRRAEPAERSHRDGIRVTPDSPEAMEEPLWMSFFPGAHEPTAAPAPNGATPHPAFDAFFADHIRKILLLRRGRRYVSKGNYNVGRLDYLLRLFPDARFVIPVRDPLGHCASLVKQHRLFLDNLRDNPRARAHLRRVGHFEFGPDRRPIHAGDAAARDAIAGLWAAGEETRGWARCWATVYASVADRLEASADLRRATLTIRFEDFCARPEETLGRMAAHCAFADDPAHTAAFAGRIHAPRYYKPHFTAADRAAIADETAEVARRLGCAMKTG